MAARIVWLASFPKSGNTWFRLLISNWRADSAEPFSINELSDPGGELIRRSSFDDATLLPSGLLHTAEIESLRPAVYGMLAGEGEGDWYVKVHDAYQRNPAGDSPFRSETVKAAIYLVRDPRDVAASLANHFGTSIDYAIRIINSRGSALSSFRNRQALQLPQALRGWSGHVESWLDQTEVPVHLVRYEDLKADTAGVFAGALEFLGEETDGQRLERAVHNSRFSELQRQERESGFRDRLPAGGQFFRGGQTGGWRKELTPEQACRIEDANRAVMQRLGYGVPAACAFSKV
jgi:aryl sulfotransferase